MTLPTIQFWAERGLFIQMELWKMERVSNLITTWIRVWFIVYKTNINFFYKFSDIFNEFMPSLTIVQFIYEFVRWWQVVVEKIIKHVCRNFDDVIRFLCTIVHTKWKLIDVIIPSFMLNSNLRLIVIVSNLMGFWYLIFDVFFFNTNLYLQVLLF